MVDFIVKHPNIGAAISFHTHSGVMSSSLHTPEGLRMAPLWVWKLTAAPMFGWAVMKSTIARTSGSLVG